MPSNEVHAVLGTQRHPLRRNSFLTSRKWIRFTILEVVGVYSSPFPLL